MSKIFYINNNNSHHLGRPQMCAGARCLFGISKPHSERLCNVFGDISLRGPPRGPTFFLAPPEKMLKSTVSELEQWFLHQNGSFFHQEFNGNGLWVLGSQFCTKKMKNISEFQNS